jgi:hypothetical protein
MMRWGVILCGEAREEKRKRNLARPKRGALVRGEKVLGGSEEVIDWK